MCVCSLTLENGQAPINMHAYLYARVYVCVCVCQAGYIAGCAADGQVYGFTNCTSFQFPFMITQPLYLSVDNRGFTVIDSNPAPSHPLFYPAVHWAGDAMNMTQALSAYLVSWLVRGVGAPAL